MGHHNYILLILPCYPHDTKLFPDWVTENVYLETGANAGSSSIKAYLTGWSGDSSTCNTLVISDTGHSDNVYNTSMVVDGNKQVTEDK